MRKRTLAEIGVTAELLQQKAIDVQKDLKKMITEAKAHQKDIEEVRDEIRRAEGKVTWKKGDATFTVLLKAELNKPETEDVSWAAKGKKDGESFSQLLAASFEKDREAKKRKTQPDKN